ncbi:MAG: hypothetical protein ACRD3R_12210, partial [Terriglobales bacterium]
MKWMQKMPPVLLNSRLGLLHLADRQVDELAESIEIDVRQALDVETTTTRPAFSQLAHEPVMP